MLAAICICLAGDATAFAAQPTEATVGQGAAHRIEKFRKASATLRVVGRNGTPVAGEAVGIEQTRHAFLFGCNIFKWGRIEDAERQSAYLRRYLDVFNFATLPFYWWTYERARGAPAHDHTGRVARWCRERGITPKGHPLTWNYRDPDWLPGDNDEIQHLQMARIDDCVRRFRELVDVWDVVNEATHFERDEFRRRAPRMTAMWQQAGRIELTKQCFSRARQANPEATLLINDYRTDGEYERLIEQLVDHDGRPLYDVIGIQSHMHGGAWSNSRIWETCQRFGRFGKPLHFTEVTVLSGERGWREDDDRRAWPSTSEGEQYQAREVERFYTMLFSHPRVEAITWWDFSDYHAWKHAPAGLVRQDMSPKRAYQVLQRLIKDQWWTRMSTTTSASGEAKFRGFLGDYAITVSVPSKPPVVQYLRLGKEGANVVIQVR